MADCAEIKLRAERRAGELLRAMEKQSPGEHWKKKRSHDDTVTPSLEDLDITKSQSWRWKLEAKPHAELSPVQPDQGGDASDGSVANGHSDGHDR